MNRADCINRLGKFLGPRDFASLDEAPHADVFVLFGGSIIAGGDVLAEAIHKKVADHYIIVGGAGHTTETLRNQFKKECPEMDTDNQPEAELFNRYLQIRYGIQADFLETKSTNCGNNITFLLDLLKDKNISFNSIILCQDATMQLRMYAGLKKYVPDSVQIFNFAAYSAEVSESGCCLSFTDAIHCMWDMDRYLSLLMGEIPRLSDDKNGYGPAGKNFIAHVDIPDDVLKAFDFLKNFYSVRNANPDFAG